MLVRISLGVPAGSTSTLTEQPAVLWEAPQGSTRRAEEVPTQARAALCLSPCLRTSCANCKSVAVLESAPQLSSQPKDW